MVLDGRLLEAGAVAVQAGQRLARVEVLGIERHHLLEGLDRGARVARAHELAVALPQARAAAPRGGLGARRGEGRQHAGEALGQREARRAACRPDRTARPARPRPADPRRATARAARPPREPRPRSAISSAASRRRPARSLGSLTRSMSSADRRAAPSASPLARRSLSIFSTSGTCSSRGRPLGPQRLAVGRQRLGLVVELDAGDRRAARTSARARRGRSPPRRCGAGRCRPSASRRARGRGRRARAAWAGGRRAA